MYLKSGNKSECSGCTACMNICPKGAIKMIEDKEGFKYPLIDYQKCINCGLCYKICPNIKKEEKNNIIEAYGVKHNDENERKTSRSGGAFIALSDYILKMEGIIYGVEQEKDFTAVHNRAENLQQRNKFKGSKYIQSDMKNTIKNIQEDLKAGKKVLFSGTPCQVAGVKSCITEYYNKNLYTCDIICHGVPSKRVFKDFLKYVEDVSGKKIKKFNFRDKRFGWNTHYETSIFEDGTEMTTDWFKKLFLGDNILRPCCHNCNYANTHRPADITIADFWGIEEVAPEFYDNQGVSLVIINNQKGKKWFEEVKKDLQVIECSLEDCIKHTYTLNQPTPECEQRKEFWQDYEKLEFKKLIEKYAN